MPLGSETQLTIPRLAKYCRVHVRHSIPAEGGTNQSRTLSPTGVDLCQRSRQSYLYLFNTLKERFGEPILQTSSFPRAFLTAWEITHSYVITPDVRMTLVLSLTKINDGEWLREQQAAEKSIGEIIAAAHADLDLLSEQPYEKRMATMGDLICGGDLSAQPLVIGFGHEPEVSFWMLEQGLLKPDEVGLEPCECYAVFLDDSGTIIHVDKFMPTLQGPGSDPTGQATAQRIVVE